MNGRERFLRTLRLQSVDRVPNVELGCWGQTYERWEREGMPRDAETTFGVHRGNEYFGLDRWEAVPVKVLLYPQFDEVTHYEDDEIIIY
ncbi:MAG: hypothetical protein HYY04_04030, partial [Chloroflexi bacterium]|nr:hypothetical protein [Chloroflexota bacterium]